MIRIKLAVLVMLPPVTEEVMVLWSELIVKVRIPFVNFLCKGLSPVKYLLVQA